MAPAGTTTHVLPMQLKIGDRLSDETGEYEVMAGRTRPRAGRAPTFAPGESDPKSR
jgi:hypothetical protein